MKIGDLIKPLDLCEVVKENEIFDVGDEVLVANIKPVPVDENDLYLQRIYVTVSKVKGNQIQLPGPYNKYTHHIIDPRNLRRCSLNRIEEFFNEWSGKNTEVLSS